MADVEEDLDVLSTTGSSVEVHSADVRIGVDESTETALGNLQSNDDFLHRALSIQAELLKMIMNSSVKDRTQQKMRNEIIKLVRVVMDQSKIAFKKGQLEEGSKVPIQTTPKKTFAEVISRKSSPLHQRSRSRKRYTHAVPNVNQISDATLHDLKKNVDSKKMKISIQKIIKIGKGGIVINTKTKEEPKQLQCKLHEVGEVIGEYDLSFPKQRKPQMVVYDVLPEMEKSELADLIVEHNEDIKKE